MKINLSRVHHPVTALGPGRRAGIWTQGCTFGCPGCVSRDTWDGDGGTTHDVDEVLAWINGLCDEPGSLDGVTISGGEPSEQPDALRALVAGIDTLRTSGRFGGDVLCYTGCELEEFLTRCSWASGAIDAVVTGRYRADLPTDLVWRGSANQRLLTLTERGHRVYAAHLAQTSTSPPMQFAVTAGKVWMVGIPRRGDLKRLEHALRSDGVILEEVSWRPR